MTLNELIAQLEEIRNEVNEDISWEGDLNLGGAKDAGELEVRLENIDGEELEIVDALRLDGHCYEASILIKLL